MLNKAGLINGIKFTFRHPDTDAPLSGGKVYTYEESSSTPKLSWNDEYKTAVNTNPVILDAIGQANIYLDGRYRIVVTDANNVELDSVESISDAREQARAYINDVLDGLAGIPEDTANIIIVAEHIDNVDTVALNIDAVDATADSIADVNTVATNITKVSNLDTNMTKIQNLDTNMTKIQNIDTNMTKVQNLDTNMSAITTVNTNIASVNTVNTNIASVNTVSTNISAVNTVNTNVAKVVNVSDNMTKVSNLDTNMTAITTVDTNMTDVNTVAGINADVTTVAGIDDNVTTVAGNTTNINTVAADTTPINTVATNIADVNAVADDLTNIGNVAADLTNIDTVATNISDINTIITNLDEILLADTNAETATTKASEASDSAAEALVSENNAAASAVTAANEADTSTAQAVIATAQANISITQAGNALTSANNADASEALALSYKNDSSASADASATSATNSYNSYLDSLDSANTSTTQAGISTTKAGESSDSAAAALASENKANLWAEEDEDVEVETDAYSAKHWAIKAQDLVSNGIIDDTEPLSNKVYSSDKTQDLHNSQQSDIDGLIASVLAINSDTAQGQIGYGDGAGVYVLDITTSNQTMPFDIIAQSTNTDVFSLNTDDTITIHETGRYVFLSSVNFKNQSAANNANCTVTFEVTDGTNIYHTQTTKVQLLTGSKDVVPFNSIIDVPEGTTLPVTGYIRVRGDIAGYRISQYSSILSLSGGAVQTISTIDSQLGNLITGVLV